MQNVRFPGGSLVAMEFSDPENKRSPNQLADIHMHILELLITKLAPPHSKGYCFEHEIKCKMGGIMEESYSDVSKGLCLQWWTRSTLPLPLKVSHLNGNGPESMMIKHNDRLPLL